MLEVSEIFVSIQGEGPLMGRPAIFLRLCGCLAPFCRACDTPQALAAGRMLSVAEVSREVLQHAAPLVVITGGEPFLQWEQGLQTVVSRIKSAGKRLQFETSGKAGIPRNAGGMVVCSPKPMHAPRLASHLVPRVDAFKFVVADEIEPVLDFQHRHGIAAPRIWLMPRGATRQQQLEAMPRVWSWCVSHGFRFSARLHILTYDDRQGV